MFNGKINYFDWAISNSYVKLPEGNQRVLTHISVYIHILNQLLVPLPQMGAHWNFRYTYTGCPGQTLVSTSKQVLLMDVHPLKYALYIIPHHHVEKISSEQQQPENNLPANDDHEAGPHHTYMTSMRKLFTIVLSIRGLFRNF